MKVLLVEDEKAAVRRLSDLLKAMRPEMEITAVLDTVSRTVDWFERNDPPGLAFFDIHLADGSSFGVFERVAVECPVIFTTAYDQYALKAFEVNSIDYLLKPIDRDKLQRALDKFDRMGPGSRQPGQERLLNMLESLRSGDYKERFIVKYGEHLRPVPVSDIVCFFSEAKATFFVTRENRKYLVDYSLDQIGSMVDPAEFFRINRKFIVRLDAIKDIVVWSNSRLKLVLNQLEDPDLVVARERVGAFREWLDR